MEAGGTASAPEFAGEIRAEFPGWRVLEENPLRASLRLEMRGEERGDLVGDLELGPGGRLTRGTVLLPLRWEPDSLSVSLDRERDLRTDLRIESLELDALNGFLPADFSLQGRLDGRLEATGRVPDLEVAGEIRGRRIQAHEARGSQITFDTSMDLAGTLQAPRIRGSVDVQGGVLRIPEAGKTLHPVRGDAVLWQVPGIPASPPDTTALVRPQRESRFPGLDLDVAVRIPSGLHIIGRQIDLELEGDLDLGQKDGQPVVTGDLSTRSGSIVFLGRTFTVRRGRVVFYGDDEFDPTLDVTLGVRVDQYDLVILITGTANKPELELSSSPELTQGDIMSVLLFGRTSSELGDDQLSYLGQRAGDVLAAYAAAELTQDLASDLGMDILTVRTGSGDAASLVVGKYLTSRALLKYEQVLHSGGEFIVNLEYALTTHFKLNTRYGSERSGLELNWTNER
jgi:autotransporter translocation and assembly factor TamB